MLTAVKQNHGMSPDIQYTVKLAHSPGPEFTDNPRIILRQFSNLQQSCDN